MDDTPWARMERTTASPPLISGIGFSKVGWVERCAPSLPSPASGGGREGGHRDTHQQIACGVMMGIAKAPSLPSSASGGRKGVVGSTHPTRLDMSIEQVLQHDFPSRRFASQEFCKRHVILVR